MKVKKAVQSRVGCVLTLGSTRDREEALSAKNLQLLEQDNEAELETRITRTVECGSAGFQIQGNLP